MSYKDIPTLRKKATLLRTACSLFSYSGSLTQSAVPNEEKHKSCLFLSPLLRGILQNRHFWSFCTLNLFVHVFSAFSVHFFCFISDMDNISNYVWIHRNVFINSIFFFFFWVSSVLIFSLTVPSSSELDNTSFIYATNVLSFKTKDKSTDKIKLLLFLSLESETLPKWNQQNLTLAGFISIQDLNCNFEKEHKKLATIFLEQCQKHLKSD